jgi:hypothetical protein
LDKINKSLIEFLSNGKINEKPWDSNYLESNADFIKLFCSETKNDENKFKNIEHRSSTLTDTLYRDLKSSSRVEEYFEVRISDINIYEVTSPKPRAFTINPNDPKEEIVIVVTSQLIHMINSLFTKMQILMSPTLDCDCLERHMYLFQTPEYSDENLIANFLNEFKLFESKNVDFFKENPKYYGNPLNVSEKIETARKFILYHELAHNCRSKIDTFKPSVFNVLKSMYKEIVEEDIINSWAEEIACDSVACQFFLYEIDMKFLEAMKKGNTNFEHLIYESANIFRGIVQTFFMFDIIESGLSEANENAYDRKIYTSKKHPSPLVRLSMSSIILFESMLFRFQEKFRDDFAAFLYRLTELSKMFSGQNQVLNYKILPILDEYGKSTFKRLKVFSVGYLDYLKYDLNPKVAECVVEQIETESGDKMPDYMRRLMKNSIEATLPLKYDIGNNFSFNP